MRFKIVLHEPTGDITCSKSDSEPTHLERQESISQTPWLTGKICTRLSIRVGELQWRAWSYLTSTVALTDVAVPVFPPEDTLNRRWRRPGHRPGAGFSVDGGYVDGHSFALSATLARCPAMFDGVRTNRRKSRQAIASDFAVRRIWDDCQLASLISFPATASSYGCRQR